MSEKIHYCDRHMSRIFDTEYEAKQALDGIGGALRKLADE